MDTVYLIMVYMAASPGISLHWLPSWPEEVLAWWGRGRHSPGGGGLSSFFLLTLDGAVRHGTARRAQRFAILTFSVLQQVEVLLVDYHTFEASTETKEVNCFSSVLYQ